MKFEIWECNRLLKLRRENESLVLVLPEERHVLLLRNVVLQRPLDRNITILIMYTYT